MSTKTEKKLEKLVKILEQLKAQATKGTPIIVEGKNDVQSLHKLDITGDLVLAKTSGKSFLDVLNEIELRQKREVILLFDFDRRGREWTRRLAGCLEGVKIVPNLLFWRKLSSLVGRDVKDIEGLATYFETLSSKCSIRKV
jgi:2,5-diamino-6-(ribosylamino)-4(3H)-pyrimidinone 5'-phosphate reductase